MANPWVSALLGIGIGLVSQFLPPDYPAWMRDAGYKLGLAFVVWALILWIYKASRRPAPARPDGHETDAAAALHDLLHNSAWAEREYRRLTFREAVDHIAELRRGARYDGVRTSGIPSVGGQREPIVSDHWAAAEIVRETANTPDGVRTKSSRNPLHHPREYCVVKVRSDDMEKVWPRATLVSRAFTKIYVGCKRTYYLWTRDARENRRRRWNSIKDNVRAEAEPPQKWPDFDWWDKEPILRLYEAACLWCDEGPSLPMWSAPRQRFQSLREAIYNGDLQGYLSIDESIRVAWGKHAERKPPSHDPITVNTRVKREQLIEYANKINERPRFLFPELRSE